MPRYLRLLGLEFRLSLATAMQYRTDFLVDGVITTAGTAVGLVPLWVAFHGRPVAGWSYESALVVVGCFTLLKAVLDGGVNPSLVAVVDMIRQGTLDFVLLKPVDAQFLVSTAKFLPWKALDVLLAAGLLVWAFRLLGRTPGLAQIAVAAALLLSAMVVLYSMWILVISVAFWVVRLDNLSYLFNSIFDFAHWPVSIFKGIWRFVFTFVIPLAIMTTYPAEALLGTLAPDTALLAIGGSLGFATLARAIWTRAIQRYTSASS